MHCQSSCFKPEAVTFQPLRERQSTSTDHCRWSEKRIHPFYFTRLSAEQLALDKRELNAQVLVCVLKDAQWEHGAMDEQLCCVKMYGALLRAVDAGAAVLYEYLYIRCASCTHIKGTGRPCRHRGACDARRPPGRTISTLSRQPTEAVEYGHQSMPSYTFYASQRERRQHSAR